MKFIMMVSTVVLMNASFAQTSKLSFSPYLKLQEALAKDDLATALIVHGELCKKDLSGFKAQYAGCGKSYKEIGELRNSFKKLSELYLKQGNQDELKGLTTASCPMANAKWVQKNGSLANPYYGKSMLECGEKI